METTGNNVYWIVGGTVVLSAFVMMMEILFGPANTKTKQFVWHLRIYVPYFAETILALVIVAIFILLAMNTSIITNNMKALLVFEMVALIIPLCVILAFENKCKIFENALILAYSLTIIWAGAFALLTKAKRVHENKQTGLKALLEKN